MRGKKDSVPNDLITNLEYGVLTVSLDFELFWGMHDHMKISEYKPNIIGGKNAIEKLLQLFNKYGIHATWATVGMIAANDADMAKEFFPDRHLFPDYKNALLSSYRLYDSNILAKEKECFFAPELIDMISTYQNQEIGSHTFSHYYCREQNQTDLQFEADVISAKKILNSKGIDATSIVLPRNQSNKEYTKVLYKNGFTAFRDEENDWIHKKIHNKMLLRALRLIDVYLPISGHGTHIPKYENGILNIPGSRMYKPYFKPLSFLEKLKIIRIKKQMKYAAKHHTVFHFWWHPHNIGIRTQFHLRQLDDIFSYYKYLKEKYNMQSLNMGELTNTLKNNG